MAGKILVLGATGTVGTPLVADLVTAGERVKAASRNATPVAGAEAVRFDYADPSSFNPAFEDVDRVYVLLPSGYLDVTDPLQSVIQAAVVRKVKVVLQTALGVDADDNIPYRQVELFLEKSGTPFVILRPNWFSDNFHRFWLAGINEGVIGVPAADGKSSFIDVRDIAASAAAAFRTDRFDGNAFNLTGPEALSYHDAAAILSEVAGRTITYTPVDDETFIGTLTGAGLSHDYAALLVSLFGAVRAGATAVVTGDVETLTGGAARSLKTYASDHAEAFGG